MIFCNRNFDLDVKNIINFGNLIIRNNKYGILRKILYKYKVLHKHKKNFRISLKLYDKLFPY